MLAPKRIFCCLLSALLLSSALPSPAMAAESISPAESSQAEIETDPADTSDGDSSAPDASGQTEEQLRTAALYEDSIDEASFWDTFHAEFADDEEYVKWYNYYNGRSEEETVVRSSGDDALTTQSVTASSPFIDRNYIHATSKDGMSVSHGIDVSRWQGTINWKQVKASGVDFVFIRCGYTGTLKGSSLTMAQDPKFVSNIKGASSAGIKVGIYYFSQAKTTAEAIKEANKTVSIIQSYQSMISLPVVCDYETAARIKGISKSQGTKNVLAFCKQIAAKGYTAYYYGNPDDLKTICDYTQMTQYGCWLANYITKTSFTGSYDFWQYTSSGSVDGISGSVDCNFWYQEQSDHQTSLSAPILSSVDCVSGGVKFTWKAVSGASKYRVFRKTENGSWKKLADTSSVSYTDSTVSSGTLYYYTVRCISQDGKSYISSYNANGLCICFLSAPALSSVSGTSSKVTLSWKKVSGAVKYRVFRKTNGGSWKKLADTSSVSYTDKTVSPAVNYTYTVRCVSSDGKSYTSWYDSAGLSIRCANTPSLSSATNTASGVKVKWASANGAKRYRVFRKTGSGSWTKLGDTSSTSFTDSTATNGTTYTYTVRCISEDQKRYVSSYDSDGISAHFLSAPTLKSVSSGASKAITIKWGKNSKASGYKISYTTGSTTKTITISSASTTSKTITDLQKGKTYQIRIRAKSGSAYSAWSSTKSVTVK